MFRILNYIAHLLVNLFLLPLEHQHIPPDPYSARCDGNANFRKVWSQKDVLRNKFLVVYFEGLSLFGTSYPCKTEYMKFLDFI